MSANPAESAQIALGQQILHSQPFSVFIGARIVQFDQGNVILEVPITDELRQQHGYVHGGVISYAADNSITFAAGSALGPAIVTSGFTIAYLRPATGKLLQARATVVHAGKRQAVCRCEVFSGDSSDEMVLCATAQGGVMTLRTEA